MVELWIVIALWFVVIVAIISITLGEANDAHRLRRFARALKARDEALGRPNAGRFSQPAE